MVILFVRYVLIEFVYIDRFVDTLVLSSKRINFRHVQFECGMKRNNVHC